MKFFNKLIANIKEYHKKHHKCEYYLSRYSTTISERFGHKFVTDIEYKCDICNKIYKSWEYLK